MSYLNALRLHFAGKFQASVSTVNNNPTNFNSATFHREIAWKTGGVGGWNPEGDAVWHLLGCNITSAFDTTGAPVGNDPVFTCTIADSDTRPPAKLVDLDSEQQMVSTIWGLEVRIANAAGDTLLRGQYEPAAFIDIWARYPQGGPDSFFGAMYQSVLTDLEWGDISGSPFLQQLKASASSGLLSIKFNVDGFDDTPQSPTFTQGRVVGTIGPATAEEPHHFVPGRQMIASSGPINNCVALVDEAHGKVYLDLGNALPTVAPAGSFAPIGTLSVECEAGSLTLGTVPYQISNWYAETAGVVVLPEGRSLTAQELSVVKANPLSITSTQSGVGIAEAASGLFVRADQFVYRLSPGDTVEVDLYTTRFGVPYPNASITNVWYPDQLQGPTPPVATPKGALQYPGELVSDANGRATLSIHGTDPDNPRGYIDGQVYGIQPLLTETIHDSNYVVGPFNFISLLLWNAVNLPSPLTWYGGIDAILTQYANLYPIMSDFLDLANYDQVCADSMSLLMVFGLDTSNPNSMPVTRDLSPAKRQAIVEWLSNVGPDNKPLLGTPPAEAEVASMGSASALFDEDTPAQTPASGGKGAALSRIARH